MGFNKKTIKDVPLDHTTVLVRVDYNVPLNAKGEVGDDFRLRQSLPTLQYLQRAGCKIVLMSHLGRPAGKKDPKLSLEPVAKHLGKLLKQDVAFVPDCIGDRVTIAVKQLKAGGVLLLENVRFYAEEDQNNLDFAKKLVHSSQASYFVQDGFGVVHRAQSSVVGVTHYLPAVAGFLLEKEVTTITKVMQDPKRPLVVVLGGAKISDKIKVIERFIDIADQIIIGGAMANTFLSAKGVPIGKSKIEPGQGSEVERIYARARKKVGADKVDDFLLLPTDFAVSPVVADHRRVVVQANAVPANQYILDLGADSTEAIIAHVKNAGSVIWNGPLGMTEFDSFAYSSAHLAMVLAQQKSHTFSIIGGGDTTDFVLHWDALHNGASFGLISTGGGASLELMSGEKLPGVEALLPA